MWKGVVKIPPEKSLQSSAGEQSELLVADSRIVNESLQDQAAELLVTQTTWKAGEETETLTFALPR